MSQCLQRVDILYENLHSGQADYACRQIEDLVSHGVEGVHVYTMNRPDVARVCAGAVPRVPRG